MWLLHPARLSFSGGLPAMVASEPRGGWSGRITPSSVQIRTGRGSCGLGWQLAGTGPQRFRLCDTHVEEASR